MIESVLANFHFLRPWFLVALAPLFVLVWYALKQRTRAGLWESVCDPELIPYVTEKPTRQTSRVHLLLMMIGLCTVFALAGPTWEKLPTPVFRQESALVIVLDLSRSMNAADIKPSRLERAKFKVSDILRLRKDGQTALLVFAEQPYVVTPLTNDAKTIENHLPALTSDIMPSQGSNLLAAVEKAAELLAQAGIRGGDVLVLTDAVKADPSALDAIVTEQKVRISVLGIGTQEGAPVMNDRGGFISDESGNVILMTLDMVGLRDLATTGNGLYQTIRSDDEDVDRFLRFIDATESAEAETSSDLFADRWREFGPWLLAACIPLVPLLFRRGLLAIALIVSVGVITPPGKVQAQSATDEEEQHYWFLTPDQAGRRAFEDEKFAEAKKHFEHNSWRAAAAYRDGDFSSAASALSDPASTDEWYNKGNALARQGQFEEAIAAYEQALAGDSANEDAAHNKALLEKLLEEQQQQQQNEGDGENNDSNGEEDSGGESQGESEDASPSEQQGGDSSAESEEMNEQAQDEQATKNAEQEQEEQTAEEQSTESQKGEQDGGKPNDTMADAQPQPDAELEQATEQWLRQIPDDPGGLLRRKFEYEHQRQGYKRNKGGQQW